MNEVVAFEHDGRKRLDGYVRRALDGETAATRALLEAVWPAAVKSARSVVGGDEAMVQDVVQDALVRFLDALPNFRFECSPTTYAARIAFRTGTDHIRRDRSLRARAQAASLAEPSRAASLPGDSDGWVVALLRDALSPIQAETLMLRAVHGYSVDEIARAQSAPTETVRSRLRLARQTMRQRIQSDPELSELVHD
ncbi:MAG: RNA polymerase sigma factor [Myxococcota bacterium]